MTSTTDTYATQISALAKDFSLCCAAAALFFWDDNHNKGLRVEATSIMREFVDNVSFGRDPEGILFYTALSDLDSKAGKINYSVFYNSEKPRAIRIDFLTTANDSSTRFASFLTKDTNNIETNILLKSGTGQWGEQQMGTCSANLYKSSSDTKVTLTLKPIDKKATFKIDKTDVTSKTDSGDKVAVNKLPIDINGVFHFNSIDDLTGSSVANYNSDRLVLYPSGKADQYVGVFFADKPLPIDDSHTSATSSTATWA